MNAYGRLLREVFARVKSAGVRVRGKSCCSGRRFCSSASSRNLLFDTNGSLRIVGVLKANSFFVVKP